LIVVLMTICELSPLLAVENFKVAILHREQLAPS